MPTTVRRSLLVALATSCAASAPGQDPVRLRIVAGDQAMTVQLADNPTARDLLSLLPMEIKAQDFSTNEKVAYPPRKLSTQGAPAAHTPLAGDLAYYAPWGNLALFHAAGQPSPGLVFLGRFEGPVDALRVKGELTLRIERAR